MRRRTAGAVALLVVALTGCGSSDAEPEPEPVPASPLSQVTIYSSLPEQGPDADETAAVRRGMALALAEAGMRAGGIRVIHRELDNAGAPDGWTPERVSQNARRAVQDDSTALYLGELRSAASTLSMPILNEAGIPQISPAATAIGLVEGGPGAEEGEPERYYPTGERHFVRLMPGDGAQAGCWRRSWPPTAASASRWWAAPRPRAPRWRRRWLPRRPSAGWSRPTRCWSAMTWSGARRSSPCRRPSARPTAWPTRARTPAEPSRCSPAPASSSIPTRRCT